MARKCKVCGDEMTAKIGEHDRNTGSGRVLYKNVRQYTCPRGCRGAFFDYRFARPADRPERLFRFLPVPQESVNVAGVLLTGGLLLSYSLFAVGILLTGLSLVGKLLAVGLLTVFAAGLVRFMRGGEGDEGESA